MTASFNPLDLFLSISKKWWIVAIGMISGGICALILSGILPPLYESSASFSVTIDYTKTGALSDIQEDQAMRGIGYVISSDDVIEHVISDVYTQKSTYSRVQFEKESTLDREEFLWTMRYRSPDPKFANDVVLAWMERSNTLFQDALIHAQIVDSETKILLGVEGCLEQATGRINSGTYCGFDNVQEVINKIEYLSDYIHEEKLKARGLFSAITVQAVKQPQVSSFPVRHQRNLFVFAGIVSGLLISIFIQWIVCNRSLDLEK